MNKTEKVNQFMKELDNPLKAEMEAVREIILKASDKITEDIKWSAPSFAYKDNMATFNPRAKKFVNLTFHKGALIGDNSGLLEGDKKEARVARFNDMEDVLSKKEQLTQVVQKWVELMELQE
ncbi:MAG: DUF1801 domain-containing protein [Flavobacteriales bacterium]|nr:DUF1801 domain-containing protein [Flavobacteriales bacterium]